MGPAAVVERTRRFDRVVGLVRTHYYTRDLRGVDWPALCAAYRPQVIAAANDGEWYHTVNAMLGELHDAHTRAERPGMPRHAMVREDRRLFSLGKDVRAAQVLDDGVVWLRFDHFDPGTSRWLEREVAAHQDAPGMILDLRTNRGGLVIAAQRAIGAFFARDVVIGIVIDRHGRRSLERSRGGRRPKYTGPLAVLVGPDSHSSAEVFAYVMQHHARAPIIGQTTAGEVLGARTYRLRDGGQLYVSVTDFRRCDGEPLEGEGVTPDVLVGAGTRPTDVNGDDALAAARWALENDRR